MVRYLFDRTQQADGSFPRNSLIDGAVAPDTFGLSEIDEDAYPLLMAWQGGFAGDVAFYRSHVRPVADFVVNHGPAFGVERWEEHPGYSPSTIAAEIAGLVSASRLASASSDTSVVVSTVAGPDGHFRATLPLRAGAQRHHRGSCAWGARDRMGSGAGQVLTPEARERRGDQALIGDGRLAT